MENKKPSRFDIFNLSANIIGPIVIVAFMAWAKWSFDAKMELQKNAIEYSASERYATKSELKNSIDETKASSVETNRKVDKLTDAIGDMRDSFNRWRGASPKQQDQMRN
jgi:hypothetical protein